MAYKTEKVNFDLEKCYLSQIFFQVGKKIDLSTTRQRWTWMKKMAK